MFRSIDHGTSWSAANLGMTHANVYSLAVSGANLFAGTNSNGVFLSTDDGTTWTQVNSGLTNLDAQSLVATGENLFVGTGNGVFRSSNNGTNWTLANSGLPATIIWSLHASGTALFAGTWGAGIFLSTDDGENWTSVNSGLANMITLSFSISGSNLVAGTSGTGVWKRPLSELLTSVEGQSHSLPAVFGLDQNYPNPFNPSTTISFRIPSQSFVTLKVFDALGREVAVLLSRELRPGEYSRKWNTGAAPSGVYFYRLQAGSFSETRNLVLVK